MAGDHDDLNSYVHEVLPAPFDKEPMLAMQAGPELQGDSLTYTFNSWEDFIHKIARLSIRTVGVKAAYVFRGQSDAKWGLESTLQRLLQPISHLPEMALDIESRITSRFMENSLVHIPPNFMSDRQDFASWWVMMQHHGAPTRLLDWSESAYIATYFACASNPNNDGAVWLCHVASLEQADVSLNAISNWAFDPKPDSRIIVVGSLKRFERLRAQQGVFTLPVFVLGNTIDALMPLRDKQMKNGTILIRKLVIPAELKLDFLRHLRTMNITADTLFPESTD